MRKYRYTGIIMIALIVVFMGTLLFLKYATVFSAERKIEGIGEAAISFEELTIPKDVRVVGIGEATHGNREFQTVKKEVFEKLVKEGNGRAICFEMTAGEAAVYNDAVHENETNLTDLIASTDYPLYDTEQIVDLLTWMREYNQTVPYEESLMIYGVDMQGAERSVEYLKGYSGKNPQSLSVEEQEGLQRVTTETEEEKKAAEEFFDAMEKRLAAADDMESALLRVHAQVILQGLRAPSYEEDPAENSNYRDNCMAENLKSYSDIEQSRGYSQILITAHNGHTMKGSSTNYGDEDMLTMGERINRLFEGSYYCIGTEFYLATVNIHSAGTYDDAYERANHDFCSDDILAYQAQFFEGGRYCLDFQKITDENSKVYRTIHSRIFTGLVGEGYNLLGEAATRNYRIRLVPADRYDAMIYYYQATPIDPIHY